MAALKVSLFSLRKIEMLSSTDHDVKCYETRQRHGEAVVANLS